MDNLVCKIASREELLKRWEYLIKIHPGNDNWVKYKENALRNFDNQNTISYLGFLNDEIICEATAYIKNDAFIGDIDDYSGLLNENMAYLAAFRTNKEYEGQGYFSKLYKFMESDLNMRGYRELCLGVGPEEVRNTEIYFHLGFRDYIKILNEKNEVIIFYKKSIE